MSDWTIWSDGSGRRLEVSSLGYKMICAYRGYESKYFHYGSLGFPSCITMRQAIRRALRWVGASQNDDPRMAQARRIVEQEVGTVEEQAAQREIERLLGNL